ncbi:hypothetical protein AYK24_00180 [Thermoplasmatales archaeon SG8-52-4]|nr:MAG: hypothetical protein AYK24_00180 [Thermoplasmatales archaeon SG8-52-4]
MAKIVKIAPSQFTERFLYLNGKPFSFSNYEFMKPIYDLDASEIVMKFSRQTSKSTTMANIMMSKAAMTPHFRQLYVSPSVDQTKIFSGDRVAPVIESSPIVKKHYVNSNVSQNVFTKRFLNGSVLYLRYAQQSADRLRGLSTDINYYDEAQDLNMEIIPVVNQSMSRSLYKKTVYSGTPKRTKGTLAELWYRSTMYEWFSKCEHCGKWNYLDQKNIGLHGVICRYCGEHLDTSKGQWVSTGDRDSRTKGFRVNLLMFEAAPWVDWQTDVIEYRKTCPSDAIFYNEVLGLEYDDGVQPITLADLRRCATGGPMLEDPTQLDLSRVHTTMGLDYGPVNSNKSKTVACVIQRDSDKIKVKYLKRYKGHEADYSFIHGDIPQIFAKWHAVVIGADAGLGDGPNSEIRARIGMPERLIAFRHSGSQRAKAKWNPSSSEYTLNRNMVMTDLFRKIKNRQVEFPRWEDFEPFADDFMNIVIEYDDRLGTYKYVNTGPDDALHSILFGELALQLLTARDAMLMDY